MIAVSGSSLAPAGHVAEPGNEQRRSPPPLPRPVLSRQGLFRAERAVAGGFALLGCLAFTVAAVLSPYDSGGRPLSHGTHRQLGLPPCAMMLITGLPCPSCGMTTSISLVMHGDVAAASEANWAGVVVAGLGMVSTVWLAAVAAGMPSGGIAVDDTIKWLTIIGGSAATLRWLTLVVMWLLH
jgi:hypothetical protein